MHHHKTAEDKKKFVKSEVTTQLTSFKSNGPNTELDEIQCKALNSRDSLQMKNLEKHAMSSSNQKSITQLQAVADNHNTQVVQRNPFANALKTGVTRAAPMIGKGVAFGSGALTIAGSASAMNGIYEKGKARNPENPFDRETMFDMSREGVVTGLGFASGPFGKLGTALSMASNLYDANQARMDAQGAGKSPLNKDTIEAFTKAELDKFRGIKDFGVFGKVLDAGMGVEKIVNNKAALQTRFADIHRFMMEPRVTSFEDQDIGSPFE